ncbi:MAG: hypothetical protein M1830_006240 [Pleopsidium flavum]|nr:MAG: hypothetical protein M1830_006240 [Pleopsidium flavum]
MLPPFRIRNLRQSNSSADRNGHGGGLTAVAAPNHHAIVQVSAPEYDATVSRHPEATLKYMDEDDGEVITVGSSVELAERLQQPVLPPSRASTRSPPFLYPAMPRPANPRLSTISSELHTFDIDRTNAALFLWRSIERRNAYNIRSVSPSTTSLDSRPLPVVSPGQDSYKDTLESSVSGLEVKVENMGKPSYLMNPRQEREHYFKITKPPKPTEEPAFDSGSTSSDEYNFMATKSEHNHVETATNPLLRNHAPELAELTKDWGSLSSEGRKQAEEAGLKLGCSIKKPTSHSFHGTAQTKAHQDRWAAYSRIHPAPQAQEAEARNPQGSLDTDEHEEPHRPLLEVFEAELARLLSNGAPLSATGTPAPHSEPTTEPITSEATSESETSSNTNGDLPDTPVELLFHAVRGFIDGVGLLASEVRSNLPATHDHIANAQQNIPRAVQQTVQGAFRGIGSHVHSIADNVQLASIATRNAADRTRGLDVQVLETAFFGLRGLANGIGDFGRALFPGPDSENATKPAEGLSDNSAESTALVREQAHQLDGNSTGEVSSIDTLAPITIGQAREQDSAESNLEPSNVDSDLRMTFGNPKSNYTSEKFERIHRMKRDEAAESREANRQRVRRNEQDAKETQVHPISFTSAMGSEVRENGSSLFQFEQRQRHYGPSGSSRATMPASTNTEQGSYLSKGCVFGCTSGPPCRHRRAMGGLPYPSRNDFHRGRNPHRSSPHFTSQLPYEYVVPPPGFYDGSSRTVNGNVLRRDGSRHTTRSRSPSTSPRRSSPRRRMNPPPGWPQFPRHGPIHLPQDLHLEPGSLQASRPAQPRSSRPLPPQDPWVEPRTHAAPSDHFQWNNRCDFVPMNPVQGSMFSEHGVRRNPLRYRQSWHPSSINKTAERGNTTRPERPAVSFVAPTVASGWEKASSVSWDRALRHNRSTGALTARGTRDSVGSNLPSLVVQPWSGPSKGKEDAKSAGTVHSWKHYSCGNNSYEHIAHGHANEQKTTWAASAGTGISTTGTSVVSLQDSSSQELPRPSAVSTSGLSKRAATIATSDSEHRLMMSPKLPSLSSVLESLPPENVLPEMSSFFKDRASRDPPPFPSLPTMEPLVPSRTPIHGNNALAPQEADKPHDRFDAESRSSSTPIVWPFQPDVPEANESSGEFFRRMTGRADRLTNPLETRPKAWPARPAELKPAQSGARLAGPFDPLAESVTLHRSRLFDGVRRSATERSPYPDHYRVNRRPYSEYFTGNGRLGWESFLGNRDNTSKGLPTASNNVVSNEQLGTAVVPNGADCNRSSEETIKLTGEHDDASTVKVVQECVDQLKTLGFGTGANGGMARLLIYAQAADGDLEDAIEMIEEERRAYKQRSSN